MVLGVYTANLAIIQPYKAFRKKTIFFLWRCGPKQAMASSFMRFIYHTKQRTTVGRSPLDKRSARRRDLYLTAHSTHKRHPSMPPAGFELKISAGQRSQTHASDHAAAATGFRKTNSKPRHLSLVVALRLRPLYPDLSYQLMEATYIIAVYFSLKFLIFS